MIIDHVVIGKGIEEDTHQWHCEKCIDQLEDDVALDDIRTAKRYIVGHAEQFIYSQLADEHRYGYGDTYTAE